MTFDITCALAFFDAGFGFSLIGFGSICGGGSDVGGAEDFCRAADCAAFERGFGFDLVGVGDSRAAGICIDDEPIVDGGRVISLNDAVKSL